MSGMFASATSGCFVIIWGQIDLTTPQTLHRYNNYSLWTDTVDICPKTGKHFGISSWSQV